MQHTVTQDRDAIAHGHRLNLVVGDVNGGGAQSPLQSGDLIAGLHPQFRVQVGQRFVHQEHLRSAHDRAPHRHPLALSAGQILGFAIQVRLQIE